MRTCWEQEASWEDFGGAGTMKSLTVNGEKKVPDSEGNVDLTIDKLELVRTGEADILMKGLINTDNLLRR